MKTKLIPLFFLVSSLTITACGNTANDVKNDDSPNKVIDLKDRLSVNDKKIIENYNNVASNVITSSDENKIKNALTPLIPDIKNIEDKKQRERILMNVYLLLNMNKEAYILNEQQLKEKNTTSKLVFKCQLLKKLNEEQNTIQQCHEAAANAIKQDLGASQKNDPMYPFAEFSYFLEMYQAGHQEYLSKMKNSIDAMKDESMKQGALIMYEDVINKAR
ncbi:hypothetical protein [Acinetobacter stercoris]|uniref:Lipoprotein n=1 Tax=Acinetobacter stercoris TaxID=2126983 RepID=A0A2U3MUT7_9GAMM|nr:hypothetical protein [Acinetobacter stercoris]SPL69125.1 hypothetical protein KPC_0303 [Acinetobacter stercoris]